MKKAIADSDENVRKKARLVFIKYYHKYPTEG